MFCLRARASYLLVLLAIFPLMAADSPSFRGPNRDGIFAEQGLLKTWPEGGPKEIWAYEDLGQGYSSVIVVGDTLYTTGKKEAVGYLFALSLDGKLKWQVAYGAENEGSGFPGARSTPEYDKGKLFLTSGEGKVFAFNAADGAKLWEVDMLAKFGGENPRFSISESVLIDGENLICTPGGANATLVALNKASGEVVWQTQGLSDPTSYCSARIFKNDKLRQIINLTASSMVGVDPKDGSLLWRQEYPATYGIHAISPVFDGNIIYVADGYKQGGSAYQLAEDGKSVKELWREKSIDVHHGGIVALKGNAYGASSTGTWGCIEMKTGSVVAKHEDLGKGAVILADGLLYGYDEKGKVGLMDPDPKNYKLISSFSVTRGSGQHWSHPVIVDKRLYIRHGNALMAYNISIN